MQLLDHFPKTEQGEQQAEIFLALLGYHDVPNPVNLANGMIKRLVGQSDLDALLALAVQDAGHKQNREFNIMHNRMESESSTLISIVGTDGFTVFNVGYNWKKGAGISQYTVMELIVQLISLGLESAIEKINSNAVPKIK